MTRTTNTETQGECCKSGGCGTETCSSGKGCLAFIIILCTALNIGANWYIAKQGSVQTSDSSNIADVLKQIQYDQAGGKDVYELYMKLQKLQAQSSKPELEAKIKSLEGSTAGGDSTATKPQANADTGAGKKMTDAQIAGILKDSYVEGNPKAKITLVEYSDLECPYCIMQKKNGTIEGLKKKYGDSVNVIFKPLNLARHPGSDQKGWASLCVAKLGGADKYSKFYNTLMNKSEVQGPVFALDGLSALAKEVGVDQKKFDTCYSAKETESIYRSYTTESSAFGVDGTPTTLVLNNETKMYDLVKGAAPAANFETIVDKLLAAK